MPVEFSAGGHFNLLVEFHWCPIEIRAFFVVLAILAVTVIFPTAEISQSFGPFGLLVAAVASACRYWYYW